MVMYLCNNRKLLRMNDFLVFYSYFACSYDSVGFVIATEKDTIFITCTVVAKFSIAYSSVINNNELSIGRRSFIYVSASFDILFINLSFFSSNFENQVCFLCV